MREDPIILYVKFIALRSTSSRKLEWISSSTTLQCVMLLEVNTHTLA